jgi:hypothetical protein
MPITTITNMELIRSMTSLVTSSTSDWKALGLIKALLSLALVVNLSSGCGDGAGGTTGGGGEGGSSCPETEPVEGAPCEARFDCYYPGFCCQKRYRCKSNAWAYQKEPCGGFQIAPSLPAEGSSCCGAPDVPVSYGACESGVAPATLCVYEGEFDGALGGKISYTSVECEPFGCGGALECEFGQVCVIDVASSMAKCVQNPCHPNPALCTESCGSSLCPDQPCGDSAAGNTIYCH